MAYLHLYTYIYLEYPYPLPRCPCSPYLLLLLQDLLFPGILEAVTN